MEEYVFHFVKQFSCFDIEENIFFHYLIAIYKTIKTLENRNE